jgi:hypothetical protein
MLLECQNVSKVFVNRKNGHGVVALNDINLTAEKIVTTIFPISPSVLIPSSRNRIATPRLSNSFIRLIMSAVSRPSRSSFVTKTTSPFSTLIRNKLNPSRSVLLPVALSEKIRLLIAPASLSALI